MGFIGWNLVTYERFFDVRRNKILFKSDNFSRVGRTTREGASSSLENQLKFQLANF